MNVTLDHETHTYFVDGEPFKGPSVTQALAQCGLVDFSFVEEETRQRAMDRGTSVHWMTRLFDEGALDYRRVTKELKPYRRAWMEWKKASGFVPDRYWIERSFVSPLGYTGTIDRVGHLFDMSYAVVDLKSGTSIHPATKYQLAAYAHHAKVFRRIAVRLGGDGTYTVREYPFSEYQTDLAIFMEAVRRWQPQQSS